MKQYCYLALIPVLLVTTECYADRAGEIQYARGAVTVQKSDGSGARLIGAGDIILEGEVIKTGPKSFAILSLEDESKMTLRPGTSFAVENINVEKNKTPSAVLRLFRGGLRAVTGFISKRNPDGYKVRTTVVTLGIRGTEFDARLCEQECAEENRELEQQQLEKENAIVARVAFKKGRLEAINFAEQVRELQVNDPIYEGDTLSTGADAIAVIVFRDTARTTLQPNTEFRIDELRFIHGREEESSSLFSLLRGGLRTVTGLIGKLNPDRYRMRTSVATLGIRGTGYDLLCTGACISRSARGGPGGQPEMPHGGGLYAHVWQGAINMGDKVLNTNYAGFTSGKVAPVVLPAVPQFFINNAAPRPDTIKTDIKFTRKVSQKIPPGLYVSVEKGEVNVKSDTSKKAVKLTSGKAGFASAAGEKVEQLPDVPAFQALDAYPKPGDFDPNKVDFGIGGGSRGAVCEI